MRYITPLIALVFGLVIYSTIVPSVWDSREQVRSETPAGYVIPSKFSRILSVGHEGLLSDFLFLKTATFIGGRGIASQLMTEADWDFVKQSLDVVTDLDPYFLDPYVLAEGLLAWDAQRPEMANELLMKGVQYRDWDWHLPFYVGFNNFYFLKNYEQASGFIMQAAELSGSPGYLKTLGARLAYYGGKSKTAVLFLEEMLAETHDPRLKKRLLKRLVALQRAVLIEEAIDLFEMKEGRFPHGLHELITFGCMTAIPEDPYGGEWVILKNGRVFSTSKFSNSLSGKQQN